MFLSCPLLSSPLLSSPLPQFKLVDVESRVSVTGQALNTDRVIAFSVARRMKELARLVAGRSDWATFREPASVARKIVRCHAKAVVPEAPAPLDSLAGLLGWTPGRAEEAAVSLEAWACQLDLRAERQSQARWRRWCSGAIAGSSGMAIK